MILVYHFSHPILVYFKIFLKDCDASVIFSPSNNVKLFHLFSIAEKKHEPMYINPSYHGSRREGLTTWSPYRAADEVTLISMPKTVVCVKSLSHFLFIFCFHQLKGHFNIYAMNQIFFLSAFQ